MCQSNNLQIDPMELVRNFCTILCGTSTFPIKQPQIEQQPAKWLERNKCKNFYKNHFTIHVNQVITRYVLNLYSDIYQLLLNKTREKRKKLKICNVFIATSKS